MDTFKNTCRSSLNNSHFQNFYDLSSIIIDRSDVQHVGYVSQLKAYSFF